MKLVHTRSTWLTASLLAALSASAAPPRPLVLELDSGPGEVDLVSSARDGALVSSRRMVGADGRLKVPEGCAEGADHWVFSARELSLPIVIDQASACWADGPHPVAMLPAATVSGTLDRAPAAPDDHFARADAPACDQVSLAPGTPAFFPVTVEERLGGSDCRPAADRCGWRSTARLR